MVRHAAILLAVCCSGLRLVARDAGAADWPMWRHDPGRSAASVAGLRGAPELQWVRELPPTRPAWPTEPRLQFDIAYEPVVMGTTLFVGSPNDGRVTAYDTRSGAERWHFTTEGPVRCAPVVWRGKVYGGSDDGHLYCLDAATGALLWTFRAAPADRPDRRHLGNARLVSYWPVRGGPVLVDGTVYFGAGIWPTLGVFVIALDAETGRLLWRNDRAHYLAKVRIDHNALHDTGLSPQGHLAVAGDLLLVPNGRSMPAVLDRATGEVLRYVQGYRRGDCRVAVMGHYAFVGADGVVDVRTGREVGSRWAAAGKDAPKDFDPSRFHLFEGPIHPYKFVPGCSAWSAFTPGIAYGLHQGVFSAYDFERAETTEYEANYAGRVTKPWRWDPPVLWTLPTDVAKAKPPGAAVIKVGGRLVGHAGKTLFAVDLPEGEGGRPTVSWQHDIAGTPASLLAADDRLFVVTREGRIYCFGAGEGRPKTYSLATVPLPKQAAAEAAEILRVAEVSEGYAVVLADDPSRLMEDLLTSTRLNVIGVGSDRARVEALRERLIAAGLYGTRTEAFIGDPATFPLPPYLASLVVAEGPAVAELTVPAVRRLFAMLRPYGGVACLAVPPGQQDGFEKEVAAAGLENAEARRAGDRVLLRRVGALAGSAPWTHECGDAARSFFARDQRVKPPLGILWYGDGPGYGFWKRKDYGVGVKPQVVGGRLFALQLSSRTLSAVDAFTGRLLWQRQVDAFARYASMDDGIYVAGGDRCTVYDPATGEPRATYRTVVDAEHPPQVADIRVGRDVILVALAQEKVRTIEKGLWDSTTLVALDRQSGKRLWQRQAKDRFNNNAIALGGGMAFCIDSVSPALAGQEQRRKEAPKESPSTLFALDACTGNVQWSDTRVLPHRTYDMGGWLGLRSNDDWLAYCEEAGLLLAGKLGETSAFKAGTGSVVWEKRVGGGQPFILMGGRFISQAGIQFGTLTGEVLNSRSLFTRGGCNYAVANPHLLFVRDRSATYVDLRSEARHHLRSVRSGCSNSFVAADGILSVPNFAVGCVCNYPVQTSFAMVPMPEVEAWAGETPVPLGGPPPGAADAPEQ